MSRKDFRISALLLVVVGAIIAFLPHLLQNSPLNKPPVPPPIWKVQAFKYGTSSLQFSQDGKTLLASYGQVKTFDINTGRPRSAAPFFTRGGTLSPDGNTAIIDSPGVLSRTVTVVRKQRKSILTKTESNGTKWFKESEPFVAPLKLRLCGGRGITVVDTQTGALRHFLPLPDDTPQRRGWHSRTFLSPDAERLCAVMWFVTDNDNDGRLEKEYVIFVWNVKSGRSVATRIIKYSEDESGAGDYPHNLVFSLDGKQLLLPKMPRENPKPSAYERNPRLYEGYATGELRLRDVLTGQATTLNTAGLNEGWSGWSRLTFSPDKRVVAAIYKSEGNRNSYSHNGRDGTICAWDVRTKKFLWKNYDRNIPYEVLQFSPDGRRLACGGRDSNANYNPFGSKGKLSILDAQTGKILSVLTEETTSDRFEQIKQIQEAKLQARLARKPAFRGPRFLSGDSGSVEALAWSPDSKKLAASYANGEIKLWRVP